MESDFKYDHELHFSKNKDNIAMKAESQYLTLYIALL